MGKAGILTSVSLRASGFVPAASRLAGCVLLFLSPLPAGSSDTFSLQRWCSDGSPGRACWIHPPSCGSLRSLTRLRGGGQAGLCSMSTIPPVSTMPPDATSRDFRVKRLSEAARLRPSPKARSTSDCKERVNPAFHSRIYTPVTACPLFLCGQPSC